MMARTVKQGSSLCVLLQRSSLALHMFKNIKSSSNATITQVVWLLLYRDWGLSTLRYYQTDHCVLFYLTMLTVWELPITDIQSHTVCH